MKIRAVSLFVCLLAGPVSAQSVKKDPLSELQAQVTALQAQVTALQTRAAKLESGAITTADIVGTWLVVSRGIGMHSNPPRWGEDFTTATFRFQNDGTGTASFTVAESTLHLSVPATLERQAGTVDASFTWVLDTGRVVMTFPDGDQLGAFVGAGGRALLTSIASENGPDGSWSDFWTGIKLPN